MNTEIEREEMIRMKTMMLSYYCKDTDLVHFEYGFEEALRTRATILTQDSRYSDFSMVKVGAEHFMKCMTKYSYTEPLWDL
jgi:hypothetical protein